MTAGRQDGFALVAAIVMVALVGIVAVIVGGWIQRSLGRSIDLDRQVAARAELLSAIDRVSWLVASSRFNRRGLELAPTGGEGPSIALDDSPYRAGGAVVRLQDSRGLFNLDGSDAKGMAALLELYGVPPGERRALVEALLGPASGMPADSPSAQPASQAPANRRPSLTTPWEVRRFSLWDETAALWGDPLPLPMLATTGKSGDLNVNTAPLPLLTTLPGMTRAAAENIVRDRRVRPIEKAGDLQPAVTAGAGGPNLATFPAETLRLQVIAPGDPLLHVLSITTTPTGHAPVRIDYAVDLPMGEADRALLNDRGVARLPE